MSWSSQLQHQKSQRDLIGWRDKQIFDSWKDSISSPPESNDLVVGWNGRDIIKCSYNPEDKCWLTEDKKPIKIYMWNKE